MIEILVALIVLAIGAAPTPAQEPPKIFWSVPSNGNSYFEAMIAAAKVSGKQSGYSVLNGNGNNSVNMQITDVENAIQQGAKVLVIDPLDTTALSPVLQTARAQGMLIVDVGTGDPVAEADVSVKADWSAGASKLAQWVKAANKQGGQVAVASDAGPFKDAVAAAMEMDSSSLCDGRTTEPVNGPLFGQAFIDCSNAKAVIIADPIVPEFREGKDDLTIASMGTGCDGVFDVKAGLFDATLLAPAADKISTVAMGAVAGLLDGSIASGNEAPEVLDPGLVIVSELYVDGLGVLKPGDIFRRNQCFAENRPACCWGRNTGCCPRRK